MNQRRQRGISLIEAMVSLVVFSVGALGLAALQISSLSTSGDTKQRSLAIWKAQELADRIRSTKSATDPDGAIPAFLAAINNDASGIGTYNEDAFTCPAVPNPRCADYRATDGSLVSGAICDEAQLVAFDIWDVLCEPSSGLSPTGLAAGVAEADLGIVGVQNLEVAMERSGDDHLLYVEWLSRSAENNQTEVQGDTSTNLSEEVITELCGEDVELDPRVDAYCVRIR